MLSAYHFSHERLSALFLIVLFLCLDDGYRWLNRPEAIGGGPLEERFEGGTGAALRELYRRQSEDVEARRCTFISRIYSKRWVKSVVRPGLETVHVPSCLPCEFALLSAMIPRCVTMCHLEPHVPLLSAAVPECS